MSKSLIRAIQITAALGMAFLIPSCTFPTCATESLQAPNLNSPADGATLNTNNPTLSWSYPDLFCVPEGYRIDLSMDATFADTSLSGGTGNPSTSWGPGSPLSDCTQYYWRVAPINGTTLGPFSGSRSFIVDVTGSCSMPSPPPSASISGIVWHDLCAVPDGPLPSPLPAGCVATSTGGAVANGIREAGEPGIAGVQVDLHWGGCATPSVASVLTDASGSYTFDGILAFGSYCLAIRSLNPPNDTILIPGQWTFPAGLTGADAFANATVESGTILTDKDFGWDYQFLPPYAAAPADTAVPSPSASKSSFEFTKNAFCREGPDTRYRDITAIQAGEIVDVTGRIQDNSWWYVFWSKFSVSCWVSNSTGTFRGDASILPILTPPPLPVDATPPSLTDPIALVDQLYYQKGCGSNTLQVAIRASDEGSGLAAVYLNYRYLGDLGYVGGWHTVFPNDNAAGGVNGFSYNIGAEAKGELGTQDGSLEYQFFAEDNAGNSVSYPDGFVLGVPIDYCP